MTRTEVPEADPPDQFDEYEFVLLWSAHDRVELEPEAARRLQRQHLGHLEAMRAGGHLIASGPLREQPDPRLRGICIYRTGSLERTRELASSDPAVKAGHLVVETMEWRTRPGAVAREARIRDDMIRVAHRAGASIRQLAEVSGLGGKAVTSIVSSQTQLGE